MTGGDTAVLTAAVARFGYQNMHSTFSRDVYQPIGRTEKTLA